jgi:hypothetical protein
VHRHSSVFGANVRASVIALLLLLAPAASMHAQMPGVAVLQNAFSNPGITAAINYSGGGGKHAGGLAGAWAPSSGRFQLSAGAGSVSADTGSAWITYGGRVAVPLTGITGAGAFGIAPFAGAGMGSGEDVGEWRVPVGVGIGYRRMLFGRGMSVHAAPSFLWSRRNAVEEVPPVDGVGGRPASPATSRGLFRIAAGIDVGITQRIGLTIGYEGGAAASVDEPGPRSGVFGAGLSYAFRR